MKYFLVCVTVVALIAPVKSRWTDEEDCKRPNESWITFDECSVTANNCEPSCDDPNPFEKDCPEMCGEGCDCNHGYLRSSNGSCVLPADC